MKLEPIGLAADGSMMFRPQFVEGLNGTPAAELAVRGWLEINEKGLGGNELNMSSTLNAVIGYAPNGRDVLPVGVITWNVDDARVWVHQSYVVPEFRGRGVYSAMWLALVNKVIADLPAVRSIQSATHVRNQAMRAIAAKQGRREEAVTLRLDIPR